MLPAGRVARRSAGLAGMAPAVDGNELLALDIDGSEVLGEYEGTPPTGDVICEEL